MSGAPATLKSLVKRFQQNIDSYLHPSYIEEQTRREFIDPFFDLDVLGWDVSNRSGHAEAYKDVLHEGGVKGGKGETEAPDYSFRIGGVRKFFVEAKKPSTNIHDDPLAAYQLRRYAWTAKLPLSILTSFNEFAVYDCRFKPSSSDKASEARVLYLTYKEYESRWNEIADVFGKESVLRGSFDRYAESAKQKRGTSEVDEEFLHEIEKWRVALARNIATRNGRIGVRELNFSVQKTIDRMIFLRLCEDRGIEEYGQLRTLAEGQNVYERLFQLFEKADAKYNSGLFYFKKEKERIESHDSISPTLKIDDEVLRSIITELYYPRSPYEFSVLSVDILGNVYEQFLGKVIRLTEGHHAKVEDKPEVKKAGGVYYTPSNIVDYIVEYTLGKLCESKSPQQISELRIVDPACGSGSFLIGAYNYLLNYHRDWYCKHGTDKFQKQIYQGSAGQFYLTTREKKRILLNNIFGIDIDSQSVEVTKLNLLLKVLEGENRDSLERQQKLFHERALPDLGNNIKCGNSLIGSDFYKQTTLFDAAEQDRLNIFDWRREFPDVMKMGGFDVVIGNPPYLKIEHITESDRKYFFSSQNYSTCMKRYDTFGLFVERSTKLLLRPNGIFGMIVPSTMLNNQSFLKLRKMLLDSAAIQRIVNLGGKIFKGVNNDTLILILKKEHPREQNTIVLDVQEYGKGLASAKKVGLVNLPSISMPPNFSFELRVTEPVSNLLERMKTDSIELKQICGCFQGLVTGSNDAYVVDEQHIISEGLERAVCEPIVFGNEVERYGKASWRYYVIYLDKDSQLLMYPAIAERLSPYKSTLQEKREVKLGRQPWFSLHWPRGRDNFERKPKILVQCIRNLALKRRIVATLDKEGLYADHTLNVIYSKDNTYDLRYLLGILNSRLMNFVFSRKYIDINIKGIYLEAIPIPIVDPAGKNYTTYTKIVECVETILQLHERANTNTTPDELTKLKRQIGVVDDEIDRLVYNLYGLSSEEIEMVESEQ